MFHEAGIKVIGDVELVLYNQYGEEIDRREKKNIIVAGGLAHIASRMVGTAQPVMGWIEVGTGVTAAAVGDTLLQTYISGSRTATTPTIVTTTQTNDTVQHVATLAAGIGTGAITEAGLFNVVTQNTGLMLNRLVFAVINKGALDALTCTWKIKIA